MRFSLLIPTMNRRDLLARAVESLLPVRSVEVEIVISDNASTDGTEAYGRALAASDPRVRYHRNERNLGMNGNWRHCVRNLATGDWCYLLSDDDLLLDAELFSRAAVLVRSNPDLATILTDQVVLGENGREIRVHEYGLQPVNPGDWCFEQYATTRMDHVNSTVSVLFEREAALRADCFSEEGIALDTFAWNRLFLQGDVGYLPGRSAAYTSHPGNICNQALPPDLERLTLREILAFSPPEGRYRAGKATLRRWRMRLAYMYLSWRLGVYRDGLGDEALARRLMDMAHDELPASFFAPPLDRTKLRWLAGWALRRLGRGNG